MTRLAISIATYRRLDGKTPFYLKRCLDSVFAQTHKDYKVFLVGDYYDNQQEWENIINNYHSDKFYNINLPEPGERNKYKDNKVALWSAGGTKAFNFAIDKALEEGYSYIAHTDHDDTWRNDHLQLISNCIETTGADWVCTRSTYGKGKIILPQGDYKGDMIPFIPFAGGLVNSSTAYNFKTIPIRGRDVFEETGKVIPSDADLWERIGKFIIENKKKSYLVNQISCFHNEEGNTYR